MNQPKRKPWLRYSLKFSLALITIFSVVFAVYSRYKKTRDDELAAIQQLAPSDYSYGYQLSESNTPEPPGPKWLRMLLGDDEFFARIKKLRLGDRSDGATSAITDLGGIRAFQELDQLAVYSSGLQDVSEVLELQNLRVLSLDGVTDNCDLTPIGVLTRLESFTLLSEESSEFSLATFRDHPSLTSLSLRYWNDAKLKDLGALASIPNLKHLSFSGCEFEVVSSDELDEHHNQTQSVQQLPSLRSLTLKSNKGLKSLGPLSSAPHLETLKLRDCSKLNVSSSNLNYPQLKNLNIQGCSAVEDLDGFTNSKQLESTSIIFCPLQNIEGLRGKDRLKTLNLIMHSDHLQSLEGMPTESLQNCEIRGCPSLKSIRPLADAANLTQLFLDLSPQVKKIDLHPQAKLEHLNLNGDVDGASLKNCLKASKQTLKICRLRGCSELSDLEFLQDFTALKSLSIHGLDGLTRIGNEHADSVIKLDDLRIESCKNLTSLEGIRAFNATRLNIVWCENLRDASQIVELSNLENLKITDCIGISDVSFLGRLKNLKSVTLWHTSVPSLPMLAPSTQVFF